MRTRSLTVITIARYGLQCYNLAETTLDDALATLLPGQTRRVLARKADVQSRTLPVPVGDIRHLSGVEAGTVLTVLFAACYVAWKIIAAASRIAGAQAGERRVKKD